jgi:SPP1 family predicted phage head-tail adaptor
MRTGVLRHYIEIQAPEVVIDDLGYQEVVWTAAAHAWANIEPLKGDEYFAAASTQAQVSHKVTMRPPGIEVTSANRIVFGSRTLEIESVLNLEERNRELQLMCKEKV